MVAGRGKIKEDYWASRCSFDRRPCAPHQLLVHWRFRSRCLGSNLVIRLDEASHAGLKVDSGDVGGGRGCFRRAGKAEQQELNAKLREFKKRQITVEERDQVAKLVAESKAPNVDIQIFFDFDSAEILPQARPSLDELGKALSDPRLAGGTFLIAGHTDAKGSDAYKLALSQRRADSVKAFLIQIYHVDGGRLRP